ncbi:DUF5714 domain-containing protein [Sodaliphilus sp.]|uniref:DUF5714 domain-containing protein n=1 Tax=Sodaliphilus sp. TaxID=2815818 RepID=UPI003891174F
MQQADFASQHLSIHMTAPQHIVCSRSNMNNQCLGTDCVFHTHVFMTNKMPSKE